MKIRQLPMLAVFALAAACGSDNPLAGNWSQDTGTDAEGMMLSFDGKSDKLQVHTAPDAEDHHDHISGTYVFDAASKAVTVNASLMGADKAASWSGQLDGDSLEIGAADTRLKFKRGGTAH